MLERQGYLSLLSVILSLLDIKLESLSYVIALFLSTGFARQARDALLYLLLLLFSFKYFLYSFPIYVYR